MSDLEIVEALETVSAAGAIAAGTAVDGVAFPDPLSGSAVDRTVLADKVLVSDGVPPVKDNPYGASRATLDEDNFMVMCNDYAAPLGLMIENASKELAIELGKDVRLFLKPAVQHYTRGMRVDLYCTMRENDFARTHQERVVYSVYLPYNPDEMTDKFYYSSIIIQIITGLMMTGIRNIVKSKFELKDEDIVSI